VWNTWRPTPVFAAGTPWLLRFFDQIRFFPVSHEELADARAAFPHGAYPLRIEETRFSYADHAAGLARDASDIGTFKAAQQAAFEAERLRWKRDGLDAFQADEAAASPASDLPPHCIGVSSAVPGSIWKFAIGIGERVAAGDTVAVIESMKMEIAVTSPAAGRLREIRAAPGRTVRSGDIIAIIEED